MKHERMTAKLNRAQELVNKAMRDCAAWAKKNNHKIIAPCAKTPEGNWLSGGRWSDSLAMHCISVLENPADKFTAAGIVGIFLQQAVNAARGDDDAVIDAIHTYRPVVRASKSEKNIFALIDALSDEGGYITRTRRARRGRMARILADHSAADADMLRAAMKAERKMPSAAHNIISDFVERKKDAAALEGRQ